MALPSKIDRNREAILRDLEPAIRDLSADDCFGLLKIEATIRNGCVVSVRTIPARDRRVDARET